MTPARRGPASDAARAPDAAAGAAHRRNPAGALRPGRSTPRSRPPTRRRRAAARGGFNDDCYRGGDPGYYNEIYVDAHDPETIWSLQTNVDRSADGGKTWSQVPMPGVHVDHHDIVFDPADKNHVLLANDGGLYETYDGMKTWRHFTNLPLSQFYRASRPTTPPLLQRVRRRAGQREHLRSVPHRQSRRHPHQRLVRVGGGDGFQPRVDPEAQHRLRAVAGGSLNRLDLNTGRSAAAIRPRAQNTTVDGKPLRPRRAHSCPGWRTGRVRPAAPGTLALGLPADHQPALEPPAVHGGERLYRSDDRGDSWVTASPDLTRQLDATKIEIMGKVWPTTSVAFNQATTTLSTITTIDESPLLGGCSTSERTTAWCRSARMAERPGAGSRGSRASPTTPT